MEDLQEKIDKVKQEVNNDPSRENKLVRHQWLLGCLTAVRSLRELGNEDTNAALETLDFENHLLPSICQYAITCENYVGEAKRCSISRKGLSEMNVIDTCYSELVTVGATN